MGITVPCGILLGECGVKWASELWGWMAVTILMMANTDSKPARAPVMVEANHNSQSALVKEQQMRDMTPLVIPANADACNGRLWFTGTITTVVHSAEKGK